MLPAAAAAAATVAGAAGGTSAGNTDALVRLEGVCCICVPRAKFSFACISSCMACEKPCNVISSLVFLPPLFAKWHPSQHQGYSCKHTPVLPALVPAATAALVPAAAAAAIAGAATGTMLEAEMQVEWVQVNRPQIPVHHKSQFASLVCGGRIPSHLTSHPSE